MSYVNENHIYDPRGGGPGPGIRSESTFSHALGIQRKLGWGVGIDHCEEMKCMILRRDMERCEIQCWLLFWMKEGGKQTEEIKEFRNILFLCIHKVEHDENHRRGSSLSSTRRSSRC